MEHTYQEDSLFQQHNPKRHRLIRPVVATRDLDAPQLITTLAELQAHLQIAMKVELSTIPPYLCALYSIKEGANLFATNMIRSVVVEEMLHMVLVANILNAIGGEPAINTKEIVPTYPGPLPHSDASFTVNLLKFSPEAIQTFLNIELPAAQSAPPQPNHFHTIGQFYAAVRDAIEVIDAQTEGGIFTGDPSRQLTPEHYYGSGGRLIPVYSLSDALEAIDEIVGQGEGIDGTIQDPDHLLFGEDMEYAHYFKFNEIACGQAYMPTDSPQDPPSGKIIEVDWNAVYNMQANPSIKNYEVGSELWEKTNNFNKTYMALLDNLHDACNGKPEMLNKGIALMYDLKYKALELMKIPLGESGEMAGPTFEYIAK